MNLGPLNLSDLTQGAADLPQCFDALHQGRPVAVAAAQLPAALGQTTTANSLSVTLASDQGPVPVSLAAPIEVQGVSGGTALPVSLASLPALPAGTNNIGNVDGEGTAGTPSGGVLSVQGVSGGTAIPTSLASLPALAPGTNSIGTVGLNAGTNNIGNVDGEGTAGTPSGGVLSVQGVTGGTALPVSSSALAQDTSVNGLLVAQSSTTSGESGPLVQGAVTTSAPSYTTAKTSPLSLDTAGNLRVNVTALPATLGASYVLDYGGVNEGGVNSAHQQLVSTEGQKATYSTAATFSLASSPTDVFAISGSSTKTIRVTRMQLSGTAGSEAAFLASLVLRSAGDTGGSSTTPSIAKHDSTSAGATAGVAYYTGNPSALGTSAGTLRSQVGVMSTTGGTGLMPIVWDFTTRNGQGIVLRGSSQLLCLNLNGASLSSATLNLDIEWTEE